MRGCRFLELRVIGTQMVKDRVLFDDSGKRSCVKNRVQVQGLILVKTLNEKVWQWILTG